MAIIYPDGWKELAATGAAARELETLAFLAESFPDECRIYLACTGLAFSKATNFGEKSILRY